jgi:hypothetical protein
MNEEHKLSTRNIEIGNQDRRRKTDLPTLISAIVGIVTIVGGLWIYSLNLSKEIGTSYAEIQSKLNVMSEKVDYLVKSNDQFSDFKDATKDKLSIHDTEIQLIKQDIKMLKSKGGKYNEISNE